MTVERGPKRPTRKRSPRVTPQPIVGTLPPGIDPEQIGHAQQDELYLISEEHGANQRARQIEREEQREKILNLRRTGASFRAIANQLGLTLNKTFRLHDEALATLCPLESREQIRQTELDRLDRLKLAIWQRCADGELEAIREMIRLIGMTARIAGLDDIAAAGVVDPLALGNRQAVERAIMEKIGKVRERQAWTGPVGV